MKNEYDYLKERYQAWVVLVNKTGNLYNPQTNSFNLTAEQWDEYLKVHLIFCSNYNMPFLSSIWYLLFATWIQGHPKAKPLKTSGLPFPELCRSLFESVAATGNRGWGPSSSNPRPGTSQAVATQLLEMVRTDQNVIISENEEDAPPTPGAQSNATNASNSTTHGDTINRKRKRSQSSDLDSKMSAVLDLILKKHSGPSIIDCTEKLERVGWNNSSPLYLAAVSIFTGGQNYRETWMMFKDHDRANMEGWIMLVGKKLGYL